MAAGVSPETPPPYLGTCPPAPEQLTCVPEWLEARVQSALVEAYGDEYANTDPLITTATKPEFGDYQCNVAMSLAKRLKSSPRDVAATIVATVKLDEYFETPEIAGPGFLNLRLTEPFLRSQLRAMLAGGEKCGVPPAARAGRGCGLLLTEHCEG